MKLKFPRIIFIGSMLAITTLLLGISGCGTLDSENESERGWGESNGFNFKPAHRDDR